MAKLSDQRLVRQKLYDEMGELYLRHMEELEQAEKMDKATLVAHWGEGGKDLLEGFKQEMDTLRKKGL